MFHTGNEQIHDGKFEIECLSLAVQLQITRFNKWKTEGRETWNGHGLLKKKQGLLLVPVESTEKYTLPIQRNGML